MVIRNGFRVLGGNFILTFKHALYMVVASLVCLGLFLISAEPIAKLLSNSGWVDSFNNMLESVYTSPSEFAGMFRDVSTELYHVLVNNFTTRWWNYALCVALLVILPAFLYNIGEYTLGVLLNEKTKSMHKKSYFIALVTNIGRASVFALIKILVTLPFLVIIMLIGYGYGVLANSWINATLLLPILVALVLFVLACRYVFMIGFLPEATQGGNVFGAFARAIDKYTSGYFVKVLYMFALFLGVLASVIFIGLFTVGAGLIVAIPATCVLSASVSFADYYFVRKENYYAGEGRIVKPL